MRLPRFTCSQAARARAGDRIRLDARESRHLAVVLRRKAGDRVLVLPGNGDEWLGRVVEADPEGALIELESRQFNVPSPGDEKTSGAREANGGGGGATGVVKAVALSLARGGAFELAIEHLAELGADEILPLVCERGVIRLGGAGDIEKKIERWRRVAESASKQSGRRISPRILPPRTFAEWIEAEIGPPPGAAGQAIQAPPGEPMPADSVQPPRGIWIASPEPDAVLSTDAEAQAGKQKEAAWLFEAVQRWRMNNQRGCEAHGAPKSLSESQQENLGRDVQATGGLRPDFELPVRELPVRGMSRIVVAIGPEGGFSPAELELAHARGIPCVRMALHVLRVPTAAACAMTTFCLALDSRGE